MELWDACDRNGTTLGVDLVRGEPVPDGMYHIVCEILVRHTDGDFLLMQRNPGKPIYPGYFEATAGGAVLKGETPEEGAMRELREETGITGSRLHLMGISTNDRTHGIYYMYLCQTDCVKDCITLQEGETVSYRWLSEAELDSMFRSGGTVVTEEMWHMWQEYRGKFSFTYINKSSADENMPELYEILYSNMSTIAPTGNTYDEDLTAWLNSVVPAMDKPQRQIVLIYSGTDLAGYFQYAANDDTLFMEEIQLKEIYHGSGVFRQLYEWLISELPEDLQYVDAYSHIANIKSQAILEHMGLEKIGECKNGRMFHYKGSYANLRERYRRQ